MKGRTVARRVGALWVLLVALLAARPASAEPGDELTISVLTFGPGDHPFFKFGHNAIWVHDNSAPPRARDRVYNFGTFGFDSPWLIVDFLKGRLKYWLSVQSLVGTVAAYRHENRTIDTQELNLSPAARRAAADALADNARDENKYYKYDYYRDNCSTRVRDVVDRATGGRVREATRVPASMTWREHTMRLTADDLPVYFGLDVAMGDVIDKRIDVWQEMFLPSKVQEALRTVKVLDANGAEVPLVKSERHMLEAERGPLRASPPPWVLPMFLVGAAAGGLQAWLGRLGVARKAARLAYALVLSLIGSVVGVLGLIFVLLWAFTDHQVAYHNENILQCVPWAVAFVAMILGVTRARPRTLLLLERLTLAAAGASLLGLVLKVLPWFDQGNGQMLALFVPFWLGVAAGAVALRRGLIARETAALSAPVAGPPALDEEVATRGDAAT